MKTKAKPTTRAKPSVPKPDNPLEAGGLLRREDVCALLRCSARTLSRMLKAGEFPKPGVVLLGNPRYPRWKASAVRDWIDAQAKGA